MIEKRKFWMSLLATSNQSDLLNLWEQKKNKSKLYMVKNT